MRYTSLFAAVLMSLALGVTHAAAQQETPTDQPSYLKIYMEEIKLGHASAYEQTSSGWPEAQEEAGFSGIYLAMESMTGPPMVWYVEPFADHAEDAARMTEVEGNPALSTELQRLWDAHGQHLASTRTVMLMARPDLSGGSFPDLNTQRFWDITVMRVKPGHDAAFAAAAMKYSELAGPEADFRTYQVMSGMPGGTYMIFGSVADYADFDDVMADDAAIWEDISGDDMEVFDNFMQNAAASMISYRFRLSPTMSYVNAEMKAADPDFWSN